MSKHNYIVVNSSLNAVDVATILKYMAGKGYTGISRGQLVKLAVSSFANQIRSEHPDLNFTNAAVAHAIIEELSPTSKRAITFTADVAIDKGE